jgi:hypothetical protein
MVLRIPLDVCALARTRFAVSPLSETVAGLQLLGGLGRPATDPRWIRWASDELTARPLALPHVWPLIVNDRGSWPQFLLPAPTGPATTIDAELAAVRRTTAPQVRASLRRVFGDTPPEAASALAADPAAGLRAVVLELHCAWERLVAPHWHRIRAVLAADIAHRARHLAAGGAERLFADLHPDLHWHGGTLTLARTARHRTVAPAGGLVLEPVVLGGGDVLVKGHTTTRTTVRYPARGVGTLWTVGTRPVRGSVVRLLGRPRARLLEALRSPATTTDLARGLGVTPGAVSQHLAVLRDSGLVTGERTGRTVLYVTTARGLALLDP